MEAIVNMVLAAISNSANLETANRFQQNNEGIEYLKKIQSIVLEDVYITDSIIFTAGEYVFAVYYDFPIRGYTEKELSEISLILEKRLEKLFRNSEHPNSLSFEMNSGEDPRFCDDVINIDNSGNAFSCYLQNEEGIIFCITEDIRRSLWMDNQYGDIVLSDVIKTKYPFLKNTVKETINDLFQNSVIFENYYELREFLKFKFMIEVLK